MDQQFLHILVSIALGISLSACAGLRAFLPLFALAVLTRSGHIHVSPSFEWIGSTPSLIVFGVATVTEILGDKFPAVDNFLDTIGAFVKPVAGTILFATVVVKMDPLLAVVLGIIMGGSVSEIVHVKKSAIRLASTSMSAGVANPFLSIMEDVGSGIGVFLSFIAPILAFIVVIAFLVFLFAMYKKYVAKKKLAAEESSLLTLPLFFCGGEELF